MIISFNLFCIIRWRWTILHCVPIWAIIHILSRLQMVDEKVSRVYHNYIWPENNRKWFFGYMTLGKIIILLPSLLLLAKIWYYIQFKCMRVDEPLYTFALNKTSSVKLRKFCVANIFGMDSSYRCFFFAFVDVVVVIVVVVDDDVVAERCEKNNFLSRTYAHGTVK